MIIVDTLPGDGAPRRIAIIGSCRTRNGFIEMVSRGEVRGVLGERPLTHTAPEALQALRYFRGERVIPSYLAPFIFERDECPPAGSATRRLVDSVDTFIVEICERKHIHYRDWYLQQNYFARGFVQKHAGAMLKWYRTFGQGKPIDSDLVEATLAALNKAGAEIGAYTRDLLAETRLETHDGAALRQTLRQLVAYPDKQWIFVSHFTIPGDEGAIMRDRRQLAEELAAAAAELGCDFFDPTEFIRTYGRETVLDANGADIYEYAPAFLKTVARKLIALAQAPAGAAADAPGAAVPSVGEFNNVAAALNAELLAFFRQRLDAMGVDGSGLFNHFKSWLDRGDMLSNAPALAQLVLEYSGADTPVVVLKAGLGQLGFLLAEIGRRVVICEPNLARFNAIKDFLAHRAQREPALNDRVELIHGLFPNGDCGEPTIAVAANLTSAARPGEEKVVVDSLARYKKLLVTPRTFLKVREAPDEQREGLSMLVDAGFRTIKEFPGAGLAFLER